MLDSGAAVPTIRKSAVENLQLDATSTVSDLDVSFGTAHIQLKAAFVGSGSGNAQLTFGQELFSQAVVEMDFDEHQLTIFHPDAFVAPGPSAITVSKQKSRPAVQISIPDHEQAICALIDTGFDSGLALSPKLAAKLSLPIDTGKPKVAYYGFNGKREETDTLLPLPEIRIEGQSVPAVPVVGIVPNDKDECSNLVGMAILSRYRLIFDMKNDRIWLLPRAGS